MARAFDRPAAEVRGVFRDLARRVDAGPASTFEVGCEPKEVEIMRIVASGIHSLLFALEEIGFVGGGSKEDRVSESELPSSLAYTKEAVARSAAEAEALEQPRSAAAAPNPLDAQLDAMMGDAPVCDVCGHITVRNGACYKCLNCGNSMGCS